MNAAILLFSALLAATPIEPTARWKGMIADESLQKVAPTEGFIADAKSLEKVWKAWRPTEEVPTVDFKKEIVILGVVEGPNTVGMDPSLDEKGDLQFVVVGTEVGGPGFGYLLLKISREGVKTVNGRPIDDKQLAHVPAKGELAALEQKLLGAWIGNGPCVGNSIFQADGTYHRSDYGPGGGHFETGIWKIEWSELPPTLVLKPSPTEENDAEEPLKVHLIKLNDKHLDFRWSKYSDSRIENHLRGTETDDVAIRINILDCAVQRYLGNNKHGAGINLPPNLKTLVDTKILRSESLLDPWGKEFRYDVSGKRNKGEQPDIWTETPDKKIIDNWSERDK